MINSIKDVHTILWADLKFLKRNWHSLLVISLVNPLLYLLAFGYGLGRGIEFSGTGYLEFVIPGIVALTALTTSFSGAASKLHVDRLFFKSFDECLMSPISLYSIIVGKGLVGLIRGIISSIAILIVGLALSPQLAVTPLFIIVLLTSCFVFALLGVLVALVVNSHAGMNTFSNLVLLPMTFLSGTFFAIEGLPDAVKAAIYVSPLTHSSQCLRSIVLSQPFPWWSFFTLLGFGLFFFTICVVALKKSSV